MSNTALTDMSVTDTALTDTAVTDRAVRPGPVAVERRPGLQGLRALTALSEVRWATLSVMAFAIAVTGSGLGMPGWLVEVLFAGCYATGGWRPGLAGLRALRDKTLDVEDPSIGLGTPGQWA